MPLIQIQNLKTVFDTENGPVAAVDGVNLSVEAGRHHAIIGQSGAGKSILALSLLRLLPPNAHISGKIFFKNKELLSRSTKTIPTMRGKQIMMIFQNPLATLNPVRMIGRQLIEIPRYHENVPHAQARQQVADALILSGLEEPKKIMHAYPFELSGGMLQRVAIAMGILCQPELLIADEPFKGLDVHLQRQVAATLDQVCRGLSITLLIITHNLTIARNLCDTVSVMYGGRIVETEECSRFFVQPKHPYSQKLLDAFFLFSSAMENRAPRKVRTC